MVKHIVMWDFKEGDNSLELAKSYKEEIEDLLGNVDGLVDIEANYRMVNGSTSSLVLEAIFINEEALISYKTNPLHRQIGDKYKQTLLTNKRTADFLI